LINDHLKDREPPPPPPTRRNPSSKKSKYWKEKRDLTSDNTGFEAVQLADWSDDDLDGDDDDDEFDDGYEEIQLNIHQLKAKDRATYSLLVQGAAIDGDWTNAIKELQRMTDAGFHPNSRNLHSWSEVMERGNRPSGNGEKNVNDTGYYYGDYGGRRRRRSWKKKREGVYLGHLR